MKMKKGSGGVKAKVEIPALNIPALAFVPPHSDFPEMTIANTTSPTCRTISSPAADVGTPRVGNYQIVRNLSSGCSGDIYEGVNVGTGAPVAIKVLTKTPKNYCAAALEADVSSKLNHKHCIRYIDKVENQKYVFLVMDYAENGDLFSFCFDRDDVTSLSEQTALRFFVQVLLGLEHMHATGIVHADIKLENIFLDGSVDVLLGDFGLSRYFNPFKRSVFQHGTVHYAAPETFVGDPVFGPEIDMWSAGVVLYCMLHGRFPFFGNNDTDLIVNICTAQPVIDAKISGPVRNLIRNLLKKSPLSRFTMEQVREHPVVRELFAEGESACSQSSGADEEISVVHVRQAARRRSSNQGQDYYAFPRDRSVSSPPISPRHHLSPRLPTPVLSSPRSPRLSCSPVHPSAPMCSSPLASPRASPRHGGEGMLVATFSPSRSGTLPKDWAASPVLVRANPRGPRSTSLRRRSMALNMTKHPALATKQDSLETALMSAAGEAVPTEGELPRSEPKRSSGFF